jgi:hypothetical protein
VGAQRTLERVGSMPWFGEVIGVIVATAHTKLHFRNRPNL